MLSLSTVIASLLNNTATEHSDVTKLGNVIRKHERASATFLSELKDLNADEFKRSISTLAASYKADVSKSGASYDMLIPLCDSLHKAVLALRNKARTEVFAANKDKKGFDVVRELASRIKAYDSILSSVANLKSNAANIDKVVAQAKAA